MTVEMKKYKLGDILELQRGYDLTSAEMKNGNIPVAGSNGVIGYHNVAKCNTPCITVGRSGSAGKVHFYEEPVWAHNTALYVSNFKGNDPKYLYYLLSVLRLETLCGSSVVPSLNRNVVYPMEVPFCPNISQQNKISSILSSLDKRIENLRTQNRILEQAAKAIYDYTFLQCAGHQTTYNKTLNRNIPTTWDVKKMKSVCKVVLGGTPSTKRDDYWQNGTVNWLNSGEVAEFPIIECEKTITKKAVEESSTVFLPKGSVTLSITRYLRPSILAIDACINQSVAGILENEIVKRSYLYPLLKVEVPKLNALRGGAQQPHINKEIVENIDIVIPPKNVLDRYYSDVDPIYEKILVNSEHLKALTTQRNTLLPLLMTGQIEV